MTMKDDGRILQKRIDKLKKEMDSLPWPNIRIIKSNGRKTWLFPKQKAAPKK